MKRRAFLEKTSLTAIAVSAFGFVKFEDQKYVGDCETTSDILGPYYRPNSPQRSNLRKKGDKGELVELTGKIRHNDCISPYANAKIEIWHCDAEGVYDNESENFDYRGTTFSDGEGNYSFKTILPVAYDVGDNYIRPAHFHLMITGGEYQPLVTQLYFNGDQHIKTDPYANSPLASQRRLDVKDTREGKKVTFDVSMAKNYGISLSGLDNLTGTYRNDKEEIVFIKKEGELWLKNEVFGMPYRYLGHNTFESPGMPEGLSDTLAFELLPDGKIKCTHEFVFENNAKGKDTFWKEKK